VDIIYAPSYQSFNIIFFLKYIKKANILIVSNNDEVLKICNKLKIQNLKFIQKNFKFKSIYDKKNKLRNFYNNYFQSNNKLWITHNNHDTLGYLLALEHIKANGSVIFLDLDPKIYEIKFIFFLKYFFINLKTAIYKTIDYFILTFFFKLSISFGKVSSDGNITFVMNNKNIIKNNFKISKINSNDIRSQLTKNININYLNFKNVNMIFGGTTDFHYKFLYNKNVDNLMNYILNSYDNVYYKPHPNINNYKPKNINKNQIIDNTLPFLLLINSIKNVISISSAVLVDVLDRKDIKSICLINLIEWKDLKEKNRVKNYLNNLMKKRSKKGIYFPQSINELQKLINE
tara:strand:- start:30 stop:1064 length:1035 start_codon:yes stop_codon:yes gene_type:complete